MAKQQFHPAPPTSIKPNFWDRPSSLTVSQKTADALRNLQAFYGKSEYSQQFTGNGPNGSHKLHNDEEAKKKRDEQVSSCNNSKFNMKNTFKFLFTYLFLFTSLLGQTDALPLQGHIS